MYENIISTILKSPEERRNHELETIIPWLKKKSPLFQSTKKDIVLDIVKNCEFRQVRRDAMITQQGKKGDCFYVLLRGTVSIYINASMADEEDESKIAQRVHHEHLIDTDGDLDRDELGNLIRRMDQGSCFGEVALISKNCIRSASVVADETVDLLVVDRILYNRCLKAAQVADIEAKTAFVKEHPYFCSWPPKVKKQLAYSLTKLRVEYDNCIVKQGRVVSGLFFLLRSANFHAYLSIGVHSTRRTICK
ncbi:hypothetical protein CAPTEDRAFT_213577 [Capitella teleta]|uniref:Cyclic nucleotide-binding domain-containing protein n=1 Tax=Capitella teleta TaxID=283909 RepID=R7VBY9_CAPTE|nr:hypothetical protein CAPTEDRAFT_213577 [Capitella teleta]|eukprot:ELU16363.1 hypothetical protein CAPTEDRAFT_213577 [Capitella teleta]